MKRTLLGITSFLVLWHIFNGVILPFIPVFILFPTPLIGFAVCLALSKEIVDYFLGKKDRTPPFKKHIQPFNESEDGIQAHQHRLNK